MVVDKHILLVTSFITLHLILSSATPCRRNSSSSSTDIIHLQVYHHSSSNHTSAPLAQLLSLDQNRFDSLHDRIITRTTQTLNPNSASSSSSSRIPLTSGLAIGSGNYYAKVGLGSPTKYYAMLMDTGSSLSWLQCKPCMISCHPQVDPVFDPSASATYSKVKCSSPECSALKAATLNDPGCEVSSDACIYTASYGDASYSIGYLSQDVLRVGSNNKGSRFTYGCGQDNEGLFGKADGILGLARDRLSFFSQASPGGFSYCLPTATLSSTPGGGYLALGNSALSSLPYKFTPMLTDPNNPSLYFLKLTTITVSGKPLGVNPDSYRVPTILDSGTVITRVPSVVFAALQAAVVKALMGKYQKAPAYSILETCFQGKLVDVAAVAPAVGLVFQGGSVLQVRPGNLLVDVPEEGISCLGFARSSSVSIIGNRQQQTVSVAYDVAGSRIGFAPAGCR